MAAENRVRRKYGIRPLDAGWRWARDYDKGPYETGDDFVGSEYEKHGPYGTEIKSVKRDRNTGGLISDTDSYLSGRTYIEDWEEGGPPVDETLTATFYYRTGRLGEVVDGAWYPSISYSGDQKWLAHATFQPEKIFTVREVDRLVSEMRRRGRSNPPAKNRRASP